LPAKFFVVSILNKFLSKRQPGNAGEMAFVDHIEELRWHIIRSVIAVMVCAIVVFFNIEWVFEHIILGPAHNDFISYRGLCYVARLTHLSALCLDSINLEFQNTQLSGQFMISFSVSFMLGFIVAFPYIFWEFWKFIKPALKPNELKYARGIVFWTSLLFFIGVLFAYYIVAPFTINFFANYQLSPSFKNIITISNYYDSMSDLVLGIGIVFELPVIVYFLSRVGILTPKLMRDKRNYAVLIIFVLAAVITPPDWFSIWLVAIPLIILYEVSITISERVQREKRRKELSQ
jgi:sec-independent protein translocase protein TatC